MKKIGKILLGIFIPIIIIGAGLGGFAIWDNWEKRPAEWTFAAPVLDFPVANLSVIHIIGGYGYTPWGTFHNGIDFGCNASVNILAPCNVRVSYIETWLYSPENGLWQTEVHFATTWNYEFCLTFESWAENETYANLQREQVLLEVNQKVSRGTVLGTLLYHGEGCHIHFGMKYKGEGICPYLLFSPEAKAIVDTLFTLYNPTGTPCNETIHL